MTKLFTQTLIFGYAAQKNPAMVAGLLFTNQTKKITASGRSTPLPYVVLCRSLPCV